jgi:hypothetical protein
LEDIPIKEPKPITKMEEIRRPILPSYPLPPPQATETEKSVEVAFMSAIFRAASGCTVSQPKCPSVPNDEPPYIQGSMIGMYQRTKNARAAERVEAGGKRKALIKVNV